MEANWKRATTEELKNSQLSLLKVLHQFCTENHISYWIDSGTLLGAIRHKGYIPWDDDIDVGMLRPDFNRFMESFNKSNTRYKFYCVDNDKSFHYPYGKLIDTETLLYEPDEKGNKLSINIDVFIYDNAPDNDKTVEKMYRKRNFYRRMLNMHLSHHKPTGSFLKRVLFRCVRLYSKLFSPSYLCKKMSRNAKKYQNKTTLRVGDFTGFSGIVCEKTVFDKMIDVEFEGETFKAPAGYDVWLRAFYGDYMQLPPPDKRVSQHSFVAYIKE